MEKKVKSLYVYPVKSFHGIELENSVLGQQGLLYDRNWMLVSEDDSFMTQREYPEMALFTPQLLDGELVVRHGPDKIHIPMENGEDGESVDTRVWGEAITGNEVSEDISEWFSNKMGIPVKFLHYSSKRKVANTPKATIPFSDSSPFLLIGEGSLKDLSSRMNADISMKRFRPNIVVSGIWPYEEDSWSKIRIGNSIFEIWQKSARCQLPNVNPETGVVDKNVLKALSGYRKEENKINFGVHLYLVEGNEISVGDEVKVLS